MDPRRQAAAPARGARTAEPRARSCGCPPGAAGCRRREVDQLVAYVKAVSDFDPVPDAVAAGRDAAARLGCFACHGPQGRFDTPNPGSLKGYIPSWSGRDFPELARDEGEIREWIRDGSPRRLRDNPVAAFFLRRQAIRMPAYGDRVSEDEVRQDHRLHPLARGEPGSPER